MTAPTASAGLLQPGPGRVLFGVSDTGVTSQFNEFSELVGKHPAVIETFRTFGADLTGSVERWRKAEARPILHISTADPNDGHELIDPRQIANGYGDSYLIGLNYLFWSQGIRAYVRPLGEPNRCLNVYASYDCGGNLRGAQHRPYWYRQAFRRIYLILHGGGKLAKIDAYLQRAGLPPLREEGGRCRPGCLRRRSRCSGRRCRRGPRKCDGTSPRSSIPATPTPRTGTDFYSAYPDWKALTIRTVQAQALRIDRVGSRGQRRPDFRQAPLRLGQAPPAERRCSSTAKTSAA